jgi:DNA-binding CsgD family transcriptional regulator
MPTQQSKQVYLSKQINPEGAPLGRDLSPGERQVLALIANGRSTKELARELGITFKMACCHRARVMAKLYAHNTQT